MSRRRGRDLREPELDVISETIEPTDEEVKAYIDQYYIDNPNIQRTTFNDGILGITFKKNYGKKPTRQTPQDRLPPQMIDEDDISTEQIDDTIDGVPRQQPTAATNLGGTPTSVGGQNLSSIGNLFGDGNDKGNVLDRIGGRVGQMAEEMAGGSFSNFNKGDNSLPTPAAGTTNPEPDNSHNPEQNNQEAHTTGMDMGQSLEQSSGKGDSEDRPTYQGKANMKGEIMTKVIDAMSDVMSRYLLKGNNRRHLKAAGWGIGNMIPKVMGGDTQTAMNRIGFANSFMADPRAAVVGGAMSMIKSRLDKMDGTNPFEAESNAMNKGATQFNYDANSRSQKVRDIGLFRGIDTYITKSLEGDSLVEKAKNYLTAEANQQTTPNGNHRMKLQTDDLEEVKFISHSAVMPYIVLACVFYKAYHQKDLDVSKYHGMFKDYVLKRAMKTILKDVLGLDKNVAAYAVDVLEKVPQQLIDAFVRNIDNKQPLFDDEKQIINNFVDYVRKEYRLYFDGGYYDAVRKLQGQNIDLVGLMNGLSTSRVLHLFATQIAMGDNVVWEAINNQGLFLGLLELTAIHSRGTQDLGGRTGDDFLDQMYAMGIVRYSQTNTIKGKKQNKVLNALMSVEREKTQDVAVIKKDGNDIIVVLKGSDFVNTKREKGDIVPPDYEANLENVAGSSDFYTTPRYTQSNKKIQEAIAEAKRTNGKVSVVGYSLGGRLGLSLSSHYHSVPFYIYEPVVPINDEMDNVFSNLKHSNVKIFRVDNSSISQNLEHYKDKYNLKYKTIKQNKFSSHSMDNFN